MINNGKIDFYYIRLLVRGLLLSARSASCNSPAMLHQTLVPVAFLSLPGIPYQSHRCFRGVVLICKGVLISEIIGHCELRKSLNKNLIAMFKVCFRTFHILLLLFNSVILS